ncbi:MAG: EamA/RhaT family transporter [Chloroflexi bacterium]|nr:MAG: EamA/RhaT family transporter [Chloroflexota bacterium]TME53591.1 MAG: EamA/RhaT family transporter [Chloroflexota bacterium]
MVLGSAVAFGTLSIFAKLAYSAGLGTEQLLAFRFVLAAIGMWVLSFAVGQSPMRLPRRHAAGLLALGGVLYPAQALTYFYALRTLPASLCVLLVYIYPSLVVIAGWLFLRRRISIWHGAALALSFVGVGMLVGGAQFQLASGLIFAFAAPLCYTAFILLGERAMSSVPPVAASATMMSATAIVLCVVAGVEGRLGLPHTTGAWAVSVGIAVVPTMVAISLFLAGLPRIGAARAALLSTLEPVVTVSLAIAILGDRFSILQALGGVLVLLAVVVVQAAHLWRAGPPSALR